MAVDVDSHAAKSVSVNPITNFRGKSQDDAVLLVPFAAANLL